MKCFFFKIYSSVLAAKCPILFECKNPILIKKIFWIKKIINKKITEGINVNIIIGSYKIILIYFIKLNIFIIYFIKLNIFIKIFKITDIIKF